MDLTHNMVAVLRLYLAFDLIAINNGPLDLGVCEVCAKTGLHHKYTDTLCANCGLCANVHKLGDGAKISEYVPSDKIKADRT